MPRRKWVLLLVPALVIAGFEEIRHTLLIHLLPMSVGNWLASVIDAGVIALVSRRWFQEAARTEAELHQERASRAVMEERERLARVLHDQIAQSMFYTGVQVNSALTRARRIGDRQMEAALEDVLQSLREMDDNIRQAIFNLKTHHVDGSSLEDRIRAYLQANLVNTGITWEVRFPAESPQFPPNVQVQLFGIFQEAVNNVRKHARATRLTVCLTASDSDRWEFSVSDNGVGFHSVDGRGFGPTPEPAPAAHGHSYGLDIVRGRARDIGAEVTLESSPQGGTALRVILPGGCDSGLAEIDEPSAGRQETVQSW